MGKGKYRSSGRVGGSSRVRVWGTCRGIIMVSIKGKGGITGWGRCRDKLMSRLDLGLGIVVGL